MYTWKMTETFGNHKDLAPVDQWEKLAEKVLGTEVHPNRMRGFILSRQALLECLRESGHTISIDQLTLSDYCSLTAFPQFTISLSHTSEKGAALIADRKNFRSVGIDIEQEHRVVKESILQRISHPHDLKLRNIEIWCLKEAVFKALMNSGNFEKPLEFSSILIEDQRWSHPPSKLSGEWELESQNQYIIARAFLKN